jgi:hypothetical protein
MASIRNIKKSNKYQTVDYSDFSHEEYDGAFLPCRHYVELSIPRSVKKIGDYIFGNGGVINISHE